jgi:DNA polymerase
MENLYIDIETYSNTPIDNGVYEYAADPGFQVLLFGYSIDKGPVEVVDLARGEKLSDELTAALTDLKVLKHAHNAAFERVCLSRFLGMPVGTYLDPAQWRCTMVKCAYYGLPLKLESAGTALKIDRQKFAAIGKSLIKKFCIPSHDGRPECYPEENPIEWETFKEYNIRDVEAEIDIDNALPDIQYEKLWEEYAADQRINDNGALIDTVLVDNIVKINQDIDAEHLRRFRELTYVDNPKSVTQLKAWFAAKGYSMTSLDKKALTTLTKTCKDPEVLEVLKLRQLTSKSSITKYTAMQNLIANAPDKRARGCFQFYGSHTGRWAGRHIQLQNLPQNHLPELDSARQLVREGDEETLELLYDNLPQVFSELIRTAIIAPEGKTLIVADFSAIEARVIAWVAGEQWRTEVFKKGRDIYCASASAMFKVPVEKNGINGHLRQKGKIAELALGYGGSVGALKAFGAVEMGIPESELEGIVTSWREANPNIVKLWWAVGNAAIDLVEGKAKVRHINSQVGMSFQKGKLLIRLPSGRLLVYPGAAIGENRFGGKSIIYEGVNSTTHQWDYIDTYGPRLVENIIQAIARDLLTEAILRISKNPDCKIVAHVHDEIIIEADPGKVTLDDMIKAMCVLPDWGDGLILNAAGFTSPYYMKD